MTVAEVHEQAFATTTFLSRHQVSEPILPLDVIRLLNRAKIPFVLVGAYGIAGWLNEPRATQDVDVIVPTRRVKNAVAILLKAFPHLEAVDVPVVTRLRKRSSDVVAIDIMKPVQQPYREVFKNKKVITAEKQRYAVPTLEMALAMKFSAMTSLYRAPKEKFQDAHDFIQMAIINPDLDREKLADLASLIYPEGGKDVLAMIDKAQAGEMINL
jgi:hypothetical protein